MARLSGASIRRQLIVPLLCLFFLVIAGISGLSAWLQSSRTDELLEQHQQQVATVLQQAAFPITGSVLQQTAQLADQQIVIWDPGAGRIVDSSFPQVPDDLQPALQKLPREHWLLDETGESPASRLEWTWQGRAEQYRCRWVPSRWRPQFRIIMLASSSELEAVRWRAIWPPLAIGAAAMAAIIPWLLALTARWSRRLQQIQRRVSEIAQGQLQPANALNSLPNNSGPAGSPATAQTSADELTVLVEDVRMLGARLAELQQQLLLAERGRWLAQLAAGFAHQFRNGLAGIQLALQLHQTRCHAAHDDRSLHIMLKQLRLLETEVRGLLSLGGRADGIKTQFDLKQLLEDCVELVSPALEHHHIQLHWLACETIAVTGIRDGLRAAVVNLLQNAIEAAGHQGQIQVSVLKPNSQETLVRIADNGPGPDPQIADRMLQSFVTTKAEGVGLGLAIVTAVAQDHGGRLAWNRSNGWTEMNLLLPAASHPESLA
ncbi:MAG: sensor histidine kinase [Planctomycetaceae bacterium]